MTFPTYDGTDLFRDFNTDGVPGSGKYSPEKSKLRTFVDEHITEIENRLQKSGDTLSGDLDYDGNKALNAEVTGTNHSFPRKLEDWHGDVINLRGINGCFPNNDGDNSTCIIAARNQAIARGRAAIYVPAGLYTIASQFPVATTGGEDAAFAIYGDGPGNTVLQFTKTDDNWIEVGQPGATRTENITFSDFSLQAGSAQVAGGAISLRNTRHVHLHNIGGKSIRQLLSVGDASQPNDALNTVIARGRFAHDSVSAVPFIDLKSGSILTIDEHCFFNGSGLAGAPLISQNNTANNFDGATIIGITAEQWDRHIEATGAGLSNLRLAYNILDRPGVNRQHVLAAPASGGGCQGWEIIGNILQGQAVGVASNVIDSIFLTPSAGGTIQNMTAALNQIFDCGGRPVRIGGGSKGVVVSGNIMRDCGFSGTELVRVETNCVAAVVGNVAHVPNRTGYTYGITWDGSTGTGKRVSGSNVWYGRATADEQGTA